MHLCTFISGLLLTLQFLQSTMSMSQTLFTLYNHFETKYNIFASYSQNQNNLNMRNDYWHLGFICMHHVTAANEIQIVFNSHAPLECISMHRECVSDDRRSANYGNAWTMSTHLENEEKDCAQATGCVPRTIGGEQSSSDIPGS